MNNLEELKRKYEELGKEIERLEKEKKDKRWRAENNENFYYIDNDGYIASIHEDNSPCDNFKYKIRNYFKTEKQAQEHLENINTYYDLMDLAEELNNGEKIDWNNYKEKHYIYYDFGHKRLSDSFCCQNRDLGQIYCLDSYFIDVAIEKIGKERLEKLFIGGM